MDESRLRAPGSIVWLLVHAGLVASRDLESALASHELSPPEAMMLRLALRSEDPKVLALADGCGITGSTAVGIVDRLERAGLVRRERDREDRRVVRVQATERGRRKANELPKVAAKLEREVTQDLSDAERETFRSLLVRVVQGINTRSPGLVERVRAEHMRRWQGASASERPAARGRARRLA